jgi:hypothetical protein
LRWKRFIGGRRQLDGRRLVDSRLVRRAAADDRHQNEQAAKVMVYAVVHARRDLSTNLACEEAASLAKGISR